MAFTRSLQLNMMIVAIFLSVNSYASSSNWFLLRESTSSIVSSHNKAQPIAAFDTQAKCEAALEKNISNDVMKLKAQRVENSVITNLGKTTYQCTPETALSHNASKQMQNNTKHNELTEHKNLHQEF